MRDGDLERLEHVRDVVDQRGINVPAVAAFGELRAGRGQLIGQELGQVAEVRVGRQAGERVEDGRRGTEVHLRDGGTEPVRSGSRPLEAAPGAQHGYGRGVYFLSESSEHTAILRHFARRHNDGHDKSSSALSDGTLVTGRAGQGPWPSGRPGTTMAR